MLGIGKDNPTQNEAHAFHAFKKTKIVNERDGPTARYLKITCQVGTVIEVTPATFMPGVNG